MMTDEERKEYIGLGLILLIPLYLGVYFGDCIASHVLIVYSMFGYAFLQVRYWINEYREWKGKLHI